MRAATAAADAENFFICMPPWEVNHRWVNGIRFMVIIAAASRAPRCSVAAGGPEEVERNPREDHQRADGGAYGLVDADAPADRVPETAEVLSPPISRPARRGIGRHR